MEEPPLKKSKMVQEVLDSFTIKTTLNEKIKIDVAVAKFSLMDVTLLFQLQKMNFLKT